MSPIFKPPVAHTGAQISNDPTDRPLDQTMGEWYMARRLFSHYGLRAVGRSVLRVDGVYVVVDTPSQEEIALATEVYLGGHEYTVSDALGAELVAAGFTVTPDPLTTWNAMDDTWGAYEGTNWSDVV